MYCNNVIWGEGEEIITFDKIWRRSAIVFFSASFCERTVIFISSIISADKIISRSFKCLTHPHNTLCEVYGYTLILIVYQSKYLTKRPWWRIIAFVYFIDGHYSTFVIIIGFVISCLRHGFESIKISPAVSINWNCFVTFLQQFLRSDVYPV